MVSIYTDGSSQQVDQLWIGGYSCWVEDTNTLWSDGLFNTSGMLSATVNVSEAAAVLSALKYAKTKHPKEELTIYTDSTYVINGLNRLMTRGILPKANPQIWRMIQKELDGISLSVEKVPAHSGVHGNEKVDKSANHSRTELKRMLQHRRLIS